MAQWYVCFETEYHFPLMKRLCTSFFELSALPQVIGMTGSAIQLSAKVDSLFDPRSAVHIISVLKEAQAIIR